MSEARILPVQANQPLRGIDRRGSCPYTGIDMTEANGQLILIARNDFPSFYYYFAVGFSVCT